MSGRALYRKYRSVNFSEVLGQEHVVNALVGALESGTFSHAYLFTGPRGVGKTSIARLLAHEIVGATYKGDVPDHIDIIEIDAASNTGVDDVRELREKAFVSPAQAKYKVYIIDEVHMLSKAAFNALLKILEEPPEHVIFILATTEVHKLPETVISRTQRFGFKPINKEVTVNHLKQIAQKEDIKVEEDALSLIAEHGNGSFRDAISLLDQLKSADNQITAGDVRKTLGNLSSETLSDITNAIKTGDSKSVLESLHSAEDDGSQPGEVATQIAKYWHKEIISGNSPIEPTTSIEMVEELLNVPRSTDPQLMLEVLLIKYSNKTGSNTFSDEKKVKHIEDKTPKTSSSKADTQSEQKTEIVKPEQKTNSENLPRNSEFGTNDWKVVLNKIKKTNNSLYAVLRMSEIEATVEKIVMKFAFPFHHRLMNEKRNQEIVIDAITQDFGASPELVITLDESARNKLSNSINTQPDKKTTDIVNVLGGEVVTL